MEAQTPRASGHFAKNLAFIAAVLFVSAWIISTYMEVKADPEIFRDPASIPEVDAVVVPGASVYRSGRLSPVLLHRMEAAVALANARPGVKLVLSGHAVPKGYSETKAMLDFAVERGFPAGNALLDDHGRSTFLTLLNCKKKFALRRVLIVSQRYHLPRALYIARRLGLSGYGLEVPEEKSGGEWHEREWAGRFKDFILVRVFRFFHAN